MSACGNNYNLLSARDSVSQILTCTQRWSTIWANLPLWMLIQHVSTGKIKEMWQLSCSHQLFALPQVCCPMQLGEVWQDRWHGRCFEMLLFYFLSLLIKEKIWIKRVTQKSPHSSICYGSLSSCLTSSWIIVISAALWYFLTFIRSPKLNATAETWWTERRRISHQRVWFYKTLGLKFPFFPPASRPAFPFFSCVFSLAVKTSPS